MTEMRIIISQTPATCKTIQYCKWRDHSIASHTHSIERELNATIHCTGIAVETFHLSTSRNGLPAMMGPKEKGQEHEMILKEVTGIIAGASKDKFMEEIEIVNVVKGA